MENVNFFYVGTVVVVGVVLGVGLYYVLRVIHYWWYYYLRR